MGLRFRRSVKICDGLKLNFGKSGMSVTVGSGPLKKTFNTNGNVTTTVGIPGTGIYWTETERHGARSSRLPSARQARENTQMPQSDYQAPAAVNDYFRQTNMDKNDEPVFVPETDIAVTVPSTNHSGGVSVSNVDQIQTPGVASEKNTCLSPNDIKRLYMYSDAPIEWTEIIAGASADELFMDPATHSYCLQMAPRILSGDADAYLEVIERMRPVDDLALYSGDFEFGTDSSSYIEVEFCMHPESVLHNGTSDILLEEFISAVAVRVARDLMALIPVSKVLIHIEIKGNTILSVIFKRGELSIKNFGNYSAVDIVRSFPHLVVSDFKNLTDVGRLSL